MKIQWKWLMLSLCGGISVLLVNFLGMYNDGFIQQHYWPSEVLHVFAGFFLAMCIDSFGWPEELSYIAFAGVILSWELMEYHLTATPAFGQMVGHLLKTSKLGITLEDTLFDIFLAYVGAWIFLKIIKPRSTS